MAGMKYTIFNTGYEQVCSEQCALDIELENLPG